MNFSFAPVHPVSAVDLHGSQLVIVATVRQWRLIWTRDSNNVPDKLGECGPMFFPVNEI